MCREHPFETEGMPLFPYFQVGNRIPVTHSPVSVIAVLVVNEFKTI
jgi:hypothetical protein